MSEKWFNHVVNKLGEAANKLQETIMPADAPAPHGRTMITLADGRTFELGVAIEEEVNMLMKHTESNGLQVLVHGIRLYASVVRQEQKGVKFLKRLPDGTVTPADLWQPD